MQANHAKEDRPKAMLASEALKKLEVMWLKRRAQIELDEGNSEKAMETLTNAINLHVGDGVSYDNADLGSHSLKQPENLIDYIEETFFTYDLSAHIEAGRIQRCFLKWYVIKED
tara:strand:+ start:225 stop:566 length:342 start_codon:yes stop_codon:yes gene_type:complete